MCLSIKEITIAGQISCFYWMILKTNAFISHSTSTQFKSPVKNWNDLTRDIFQIPKTPTGQQPKSYPTPPKTMVPNLAVVNIYIFITPGQRSSEDNVFSCSRLSVILSVHRVKESPSEQV